MTIFFSLLNSSAVLAFKAALKLEEVELLEELKLAEMEESLLCSALCPWPWKPVQIW